MMRCIGDKKKALPEAVFPARPGCMGFKALPGRLFAGLLLQYGLQLLKFRAAVAVRAAADLAAF